MAEVWLVEVAKGIGKFFLHPVFYFSIILALFAGYMRMKRERKDFHVRVHSLSHELRNLLPAGLVAGLFLSIIFLASGFVMPVFVIQSIAVATILLAVLGNARLLSPAWSVGMPLVLLFAANAFEWDIPYVGKSIDAITPALFLGLSVCVGLLLLTEGFLMLKDGLRDVSPKLRASRRGLTVGAHQTKRLWLVPVFLFIPSGPLSAPFEWWPILDWGASGYTPILIPLLIGFQQQTQTLLPEKAVERIGKQVTLLGLVVTLVAVSGYWLETPYIVPGSVLLAVLGRMWISYRHRVREGSTLYYFTPRNTGVIILDVIPESPADKMGLRTGEVIKTCNSVPVRTKQDVYEALLKNRAYCKLEVFDVNGEIRLLQRALYEGDHHELGILFVEKRKGKGVEQAVQ